MKRLFCFIIITFIVSLSLVTAFAHSGKTDEDGGHYVSDTGEYHYHHGLSAHQHPNGECPYATTKKSSIDWEKAKGDSNIAKRYSTNSVTYRRTSTTQATTSAKDKPLFTVTINGDMPWYFWAMFGITIFWTVPITIYEIYKSVKKNDNQTDKKDIEPKSQAKIPGFENLADDVQINFKRETDSYQAIEKYSKNSLYQLYVVGKDIPQGSTEFTARGSRGGHITIFTNNDSSRKYIDFKKPLRVDLKEGQKVETFNCRWKSINKRSE